MCSKANSVCPNLALDSGELGEPNSKIEILDSPEDSTQNLEQDNSGDTEEGEESPADFFPLIDVQTVDITEGYNLPNLPITIHPENLIDKIVYYGDKKAKVKSQINDTEFRVEYGKGKSGAMDYNEIIRQLTHLNEDDHERWEIEEIQGHKWAKGKREEK